MGLGVTGSPLQRQGVTAFVAIKKGAAAAPHSNAANSSVALEFIV
jgi:hypothetical protein